MVARSRRQAALGAAARIHEVVTHFFHTELGLVWIPVYASEGPFGSEVLFDHRVLGVVESAAVHDDLRHVPAQKGAFGIAASSDAIDCSGHLDGKGHGDG